MLDILLLAGVWIGTGTVQGVPGQCEITIEDRVNAVRTLGRCTASIMAPFTAPFAARITASPTARVRGRAGTAGAGPVMAGPGLTGLTTTAPTTACCGRTVAA